MLYFFTRVFITNTMISFDYASTYQEYEMAIDCGNDVNETDYDGSTPLFHVSTFNMNDYFIEYDKIVDLFIEYGADIDHQDYTGCTALMKSNSCLLYTSPSPRDRQKSRMPSSA